MTEPDREELLKRDVLLVATAGCSLVNGMHFSPWFDPVAILMKPFLAGTLLGSPIVFLYLTSLFISLMTIAIAGIPAAVYERVRGLEHSDAGSLGLWLAATVMLAIPALLAAGG
jgi:hypothetical protein